MSKDFIVEDQSFSQTDFSVSGLNAAEYENCTFEQCSFSNVDLARLVFTNCVFEASNFSLANISNTAFREVSFKGCKMLGLHFDECNPFLFSVSFVDCQLNLSSFYKMKLKKTTFNNCNLLEVDFTEADLTQSVFECCEMSGVIFDRSILEKVDFTSSFNYAINPETNKIKKARFSKEGVIGLLNKYDIIIE